jgi:hypothetical protein
MMALGGCTEDTDDVATLADGATPRTASPTASRPASAPATEGGQGAASPAEPAPPAPAEDYDAAQADAAYEFVACLTAAEVPAEVIENPGSGAIVWPKGTGWIYTLSEDFSQRGGANDGKELTPEEQQAFARAHEGANALVIDGEDLSAAWDECRTSSGYFLYDPPADPAVELLEKQAIVQSTNTWAACARGNGYPDLGDVTAVADNYATWPWLYLPSEMTPQELRELLYSCSLVGEGTLRASVDSEDARWVEPMIGFTGQEAVAASSEPHPDAEHLGELRRILEDAMAEAAERVYAEVSE